MNKKRVKLLNPRNVFGHRLDAGSVVELPAQTALDLVERGNAVETKEDVFLLINGDSFVLADGALVPAEVENAQPKARKRKRKQSADAETGEDGGE